MRIETWPLDKIHPNDWNPNEMEEQLFQSLVVSVRRYGVLQPILIRPDGTIIKGEKRWRAAGEAGITELICVIAETSDEEAKLLTVSLSRLRGHSNEGMLSALLDELSVHFPADELALHTGFKQEELDQLLQALHTDTEVDPPVEDDQFDVQGALDQIKEPETRRGDIWRLGRHILMCGDAASEEDALRLMDGVKAALVVTDPPYNVAIESDSVRLAADGRDKILNDDMSAAEFDSFLHRVFVRYAGILDQKAAIYVFHPSSFQRDFENAMNDAGIIVRTQCIWVKNSPTFGWSQYRFQHEPVFYGFLKGHAPMWYGDRKQSTVWRAGLPMDIPEPATVWEVSRGDVTKYVHPTQKPLDLLAIPIGNSSKKGDVVVDFFGGSGSTLMTCEQMGRSCRTMELDPVFCEVIKKRFHEGTGIEPVLLFRSEIAA